MTYRLFLTSILLSLGLVLVGCGSGADGTSSGQDFRFLSINQDNLNGINGGLVGPTSGEVGPGTGNPVDFGGGGNPGQTSTVAFLYLGIPAATGGISSFEIISDGTLTPIEDIPLRTGSQLGISPNSEFLYYSTGDSGGSDPDPDEAIGFTIDRSTGRLSPNGTVTTPLDEPSALITDLSERFAYTLHQTSVASYTVDNSGQVTSTGAIPIPTDTGLFRPLINAAGTILYKINTAATVTILSIDQFTGVLSYLNPGPNEQGFPVFGAQTVSGAISRDQNFLYIVNGGSDSISTYTILLNGGLEDPPLTAVTEAGPTDLALHPTLPVLYVAGTSGTIQSFTTNANGSLQTLGVSIPTVAPLRRVLVDPNGSVVVVLANNGTISVYGIGATGELTLLNENSPSLPGNPVDAAVVSPL